MLVLTQVQIGSVEYAMQYQPPVFVVAALLIMFDVFVVMLGNSV